MLKNSMCPITELKIAELWVLLKNGNVVTNIKNNDIVEIKNKFDGLWKVDDIDECVYLDEMHENIVHIDNEDWSAVLVHDDEDCPVAFFFFFPGHELLNDFIFGDVMIMPSVDDQLYCYNIKTKEFIIRLFC